MKDFNPIKLIVVGVIGILILTTIFSSFYTVHSGERGILFRFGHIVSITDDGLHMKFPFVDDVKLVDVRTQKVSTPAGAGTKDMQNVDTVVALNYHFDHDKLADTYNRVGLDVDVKIIDPRIQEIVKSVIAKYSAEELLLKRETIKDTISTNLRASLVTYNIIVEDIQITNFTFSKEFSASIEAKQTSLQKALKAQNDLQTIKIEAEQKIAMAQAEAESIRIQSAAIKEQGGHDYVSLKAIEKWSGVLPTTMMSEDVKSLLSVPIK